MAIAELLGPFAAELDEQGITDGLRFHYQNLLTEQGIVLPGPEIKAAEHGLNARVAVQRGEVWLNDDGSPADDPAFDIQAAAQLLHKNRGVQRNGERFDSLVELGLLSRAASLAAQLAIQHDPGGVAAKMFPAAITGFKHFTQIGMLVEEWALPWQKVVERNFEGEPLAVPLGAIQVRYAMGLLDSISYEELADRHFKLLSPIRFAIYQGLSESAALRDSDTSHLALASGVGLFQRQSPDGASLILRKFQERDRLPGYIDWPAEVAVASQRAEHFFTEP